MIRYKTTLQKLRNPITFYREILPGLHPDKLHPHPQEFTDLRPSIDEQKTHIQHAQERHLWYEQQIAKETTSQAQEAATTRVTPTTCLRPTWDSPNIQQQQPFPRQQMYPPANTPSRPSRQQAAIRPLQLRSSLTALKSPTLESNVSGVTNRIPTNSSTARASSAGP